MDETGRLYALNEYKGLVKRLIIVLVVFTLIIVVLIAAIIVLIYWWKIRMTDVPLRKSTWHTDDCNAQCPFKTMTERPPLVVFSLDGFAANYFEKNLSQSLNIFAECGTRSENLLPSFPSKTFPNHYTIVTGLYTESHGVIDNQFFDPSILEEFIYQRTTKNPKWYLGEPIWNTVEKAGRKSASIMWAASEVAIQGMLPTYNIKYNSSMSLLSRINQVIEWLQLSDEQRPSLILVYINEPDSSGHHDGPDSDEVGNAMMNVDGAIGQFMATLYRLRLINCVNVVVLSDHGMQKVREKLYFNELFNNSLDNLEVFTGPVTHIHFKGNDTIKMEEKRRELISKLRCGGGAKFRLYERRKNIPKRFHFSRSERIGDILIECNDGITTFGKKGDDYYPLVGEHGHDPYLSSMRAIFMARGPSIRVGHRVGPFENIELYNLFSDLLDLKNPAPNNGTVGALDSFLRHPPMRSLINTTITPACNINSNIVMNQEQTRNASSTKTTIPSCVNWSSPSFPDASVNNEKNKPNDFCVINTCRTQTIYAANRIIKSSTSYVTAKSRSNFKIPKCDNGICNNDDVVQVPLQLFDEVDQKAPMINLHRGFVTDVLQQLVHLIQHYAKLVDRSQPTDLFVILFYCNQWASSPDSLKCAQPEMTNTLSFVFPNQPQDDNCLTRLAYFEQNTVRLRDVELLTGLRWFRDGDPFVSQWERIRVNDRLWQLDKKNNQYGDDV